MSFILCLLLFLFGGPTAKGQTVNLCQVTAKPASYNGRIISIRGTTFNSVDHSGLYSDNGKCELPINLRPPDTSDVKVGFKLRKDDEWRKYKYYDSFNRGFGTDPAAISYKVTATFHGLIIYRPQDGPFANTLTMILESVSDVNVEEQ